MKPIATAADLDEACSQPFAIVFLWVAWAIQARESRLVVQKLSECWQTQYPTLAVVIYVADVGEQEGEVWEAVRNWLNTEGQPTDHLTFGGCGALIWMRSGSVVANVSCAKDHGIDALVAMSRGAFEFRDEPR